MATLRFEQAPSLRHRTWYVWLDNAVIGTVSMMRSDRYEAMPVRSSRVFDGPTRFGAASAMLLAQQVGEL